MNRMLVGIGVLLLLLNALASSAWQCYEHARRPEQAGDPVGSYLLAMEPLRRYLKGETEVGFLTDLPPEKLFSDAEATARYYLAQYALVPAVVKNGARAERVVGAFSNRRARERAARLHHLRAVKDFGHVVLWEQGGAE